MSTQRENALVVINSRLQPFLDENIIKDIEKGIYNWSIDYATSKKITKNWNNPIFTALYHNRVRSIISNLDPTSSVGNMRLLKRLQDKEFLPSQLGHMSHEDLYPENWKSIIDDKMRKDEHIYDEKPAAMTDLYKCGKCKKRECIYQELQLRACDESSSLFIYCVNCGNRWRIG